MRCRRRRCRRPDGLAWSSTAPTAPRVGGGGTRAVRGWAPRSRVLHADPDGTNINDGCGSTHPGCCRPRVVAAGAHAGLAVRRRRRPGARGRRHRPPRQTATTSSPCAPLDRHERGRLPGDTVVVTVMTNLGFRLGMAERGLHVVDTRWATATSSRPSGGRLGPRRRAVRPHHLPRPRHHRRRPAHRRAGARRDGPQRADRSPSWPTTP